MDSNYIRTRDFGAKSSISMPSMTPSTPQTGTTLAVKTIQLQPAMRTSQRFKGSDSWNDGSIFKNIVYKTRKGLENRTSLELIRSGERTAFSSDSLEYSDVHVGDLFRLTNRTDNVTVRITEQPYPTELISADEWSAFEGLDPSLHGALFGQKGYFQFRFELVNPSPIDPKWKPINGPTLVTQIGGSQPRRFRLPDKTTMEQDFALDLPETASYLLLGGPGTGKSVIALLRARRLARKRHPHKFLAFNQLLVHASKNLDAKTANNLNMTIRADTWIAWFRSTWRNLVGTACPHREHVFQIDWSAVRFQLDAKFPRGVAIPKPNESYLVIDEGQDMPKDFYEILVEMGYENIFVVADFNQILHQDSNSNYPDLCNALEKTASLRFSASASSKERFTVEHVVQLTYNHRNSYPVAQLARSFHITSPQNVPPNLPLTTRTAEVPVLEKYDGSEPEFLKIIRRILLTADSAPTKLIGVLCPDNEVRQRYKQAFEKAVLSLSNEKPRIDSYAKDDRVLPDFAFGGIILLNAQACKGLEFDYVVIADIDQFKCWPAIEDERRMLFYVMVSRAIERVIMIQNTANPCPVSVILPTDKNLLRG
ncbi:MAG: ATP-binding domain-containing protein [Rhodoferax sp.]|uniref:ATP-binding domain-containing protein n=2 Tax=Rhodoferax sp. TaxID=50421 RepID=UPI0017D75585|nr:ATP-binding domain-containing protein [Rhodoferax sp.]NMM12070.1 ATP-binding domain-containing protein [Rhodoferax sp.]